MLWSNGLQIDHIVTYSYKTSAVLHTAHMGHVEDVLANRAAVGHALHRNHCQCFSFLASFAFEQHSCWFSPSLEEWGHPCKNPALFLNEWEKRVMRVQQYTQIAVYVRAYAFVWKLTSFSCFVRAASQLTSSLSSLRVAWVQVRLQNCSLRSNSAESSVLPPSSASPRWSVRRLPPPPPPPFLSFASSALCH